MAPGSRSRTASWNAATSFSRVRTARGSVFPVIGRCRPASWPTPGSLAALVRQELLDLGLDALHDDAAPALVALEHGLGGIAGLLERRVRRGRRDAGVGAHVQHRWLVGCQRPVPGRAD